MDIKKQTAEILRELREKKGMTRKEIAGAFGKSEKTVDAWENARTQPDITTFFELCRLYGVENIEKTFMLPTVSISEQQKKHEKEVILAYRANPDMQKAVDRLLKIEK